MYKNNSPQKLSIFAICLNQRQDLNKIKENFSFADDIILIGFDFEKNLVLESDKNNIRLIDLLTINQPIFHYAKNDTIFLLDLDENINESLKDEIIHIVENGLKNNAYLIEREFVFLNKKIKHGAVENNTEIRLFDRNSCSVKSNFPLIGKVICNEGTVKLTNKIQNLSYKDFDSYNNKQTIQSNIIANLLFKKGCKTNIFKLLSIPFLFFIKQYFIKLGFLDKKEGYILAYIHSFGKLKSQIILWLLIHNMN